MTASVDWSTASENPAQVGFINDTSHRHVAFVGGLGSGKTWSGAIKTILYAMRYQKCLMLVAAPTYRQLRDSTMREFFKLLPNEMVQNYNKSEYELSLKNGTEILFRSLENYDSIRGIEFAYIWIDEANLISHKAWQVTVGRLRQPGFPHVCCVTTTPRGRTDNWLYSEFVTKPLKNKKLSRNTYHARTRDNVQNVGEGYIYDLEVTYTGDFAKQELLGEFVDIIEGRVYPEFERQYHVDYFGENIIFQPHLPLYGFWDYGIGDAGALWLAQTIDMPEHDSIPYKDPNDSEGPWIERKVPSGPGMVLIDLITEDGENVDYWIETAKMIDDRWKPVDTHYGDPAGEQRSQVTGKSMAQHLREAGIFVRSKVFPSDEGRKMITKLLVERRLFVSSECQAGISSFSNYHWPLDPDGKRRIGSKHPVHDWSSHPMDALRYGVTHLFPIFAPSPLGAANLRKRTKSSTSSKGPRAPRSGGFVGRGGMKREAW